jgi:serine/threonine-protein kinase
VRPPDRPVLDVIPELIRPDRFPDPVRPDDGADDGIPPEPVPQDTTPALVSVPDVRGRPHREAVALIDAAGLKPGPAEFRDASRPDGTVLDQAPDPGSSVRPGTAVLLVVARSVRVPDLRNRPVEAAGQVLAGLRLGDITPVPSEAAPGLVIDQRPAAGSFAPRGTAVDVAVADDLVTVPELRGLDERAARAAIGRGLLAVGSAGRALASDGSGTVVRQSPPPGASVPAGTPVEFLIADRGVDVPELAGRALAEARDALRRAELTLRAVDSLASERPTGTVLAQRPAAGTLVAPGTGVAVEVAAGVPVPALMGRPHEEARRALEAARLLAASAEREPSDRDPGTVIRQAPQAGTVVPLGTAVAIAVARGVTVPDLAAADSAGASRTLAGVPLGVGRVVTRPAAEPPGTVVDQDPAPGVEVAPGAPVDLVLSRWIAVPALVGRDTADAATLAADSLGVVFDPRWRLRGSAAVLEQEPAAGALVPPGSSVFLTVARPIPPLVLATAGVLLLGAGGLVARRARRPGGAPAPAGRTPVPVPVPPLPHPPARAAPRGRTRDAEPPEESGRTQPELRAIPDRMPRLRTSRNPSAEWEFRWRPVFDEGELTMAIPGTLIANRAQVPDATPVATDNRNDERVPLDARRST